MAAARMYICRVKSGNCVSLTVSVCPNTFCINNNHVCIYLSYVSYVLISGSDDWLQRQRHYRRLFILKEQQPNSNTRPTNGVTSSLTRWLSHSVTDFRAAKNHKEHQNQISASDVKQINVPPCQEFWPKTKTLFGSWKNFATFITSPLDDIWWIFPAFKCRKIS